MEKEAHFPHLMQLVCFDLVTKYEQLASGTHGTETQTHYCHGPRRVWLQGPIFELRGGTRLVGGDGSDVAVEDPQIHCFMVCFMVCLRITGNHTELGAFYLGTASFFGEFGDRRKSEPQGHFQEWASQTEHEITDTPNCEERLPVICNCLG